MATLDDLEQARKALQYWQDKFDSYSGNDPDKYRSQIREASSIIREIERDLKNSGVIKLSEREQVSSELDIAFPDAKSKQVVEFRGKRYQRRFYPLERSRSGKRVTEWGRTWDEVGEVAMLAPASQSSD